MNGFWEQQHRLLAEDVDLNGSWRVSRIFTDMQEAGGAHSEQNGLGMRAMWGQGLAWVLSRVQLRMTRLPRIGETVTVRTWPKPPQHFFFPRHYRFMVDGEEIGTAATLYVQLDTESRRMAKPWLGGQEELTCDTEPAYPLPAGVPAVDAEPMLFTRTAQYSDLDINGHVNNTRYLDWYCDCFDSAHHTAYALMDVLIHYNREIRPEEQVALALRSDGLHSVLTGSVAGAQCFSVSGHWQARAAA